MERGQRLEAEAAAAYDVMHGAESIECGLALTDCGKFGASADRLVGLDGGIEIKCPVGASQIACLSQAERGGI
jgi:hypothetical protein